MAALNRPWLRAALGLTLLWTPAAHASGALDQPGSSTDRYLDPGEVTIVLHAANEPLFECFRRYGGPDEVGEVTVGFKVGPDGAPGSVTVETREGLDELRSCLDREVSALRFPEHDGAPLEAAYPLVYQTDLAGGGARLLNYPLVFVREIVPRMPMVTLNPALDEEQRARIARFLYGSDSGSRGANP